MLTLQQTQLTDHWSKRSRLAFYLRWVLANAVGGTIGWMLSVATAPFTLGIGLAFAGIIVGLSVGTAQGLVLWRAVRHFDSYRIWALETSRWLRENALFQELARPEHWVMFTAVWAAFTAVALNLCIITLYLVIFAVGPFDKFELPQGTTFWWDKPLTVLASSISAGVVFGVLQWVLLRFLIRKATLWVFFAAVGWCIGLAAGHKTGEYVASIVFPNQLGQGIIIGPADMLYFLVAGAIGTTLFAIITGVGFVWLLRRGH